MGTEEEIQQQRELLTSYRRTLAVLRQQEAQTGLFVPPHIVNGIHEARRNISQIKKTLRHLGVSFEDLPDENMPSSSEPDRYSITTPLITLHQLREPVNEFTGREAEIEQIAQVLKQAAEISAKPTLLCIRGLGGIGKTELAYAAAQRVLPLFPDAQFLIELSGASSNPLKPVQALQTVIHAFDREALLPDDLEELKAVYRTTLIGKRVLIFANSARDITQVQPLIPPPGSALLITSRQHFNLFGMTTFDLGTLSQQESELLLLKLCPRIAASAKVLAQLCGHLPLALQVSANLLANYHTLRVTTYLEKLTDEHTRLAHLRNPDIPSLDVRASFNLSYAALNATSRHILNQLSVFTGSFDHRAAQDVVDLDISDSVIARDAVLTSEAVLTQLPIPSGEIGPMSNDLETHLSILYRCSLIEWDEALNRYNMHDLVRLFAAEFLTETTQDAVRERHARYYLNLTNWTASLSATEYEREALTTLDIERLHLQAAQEFLAESVQSERLDMLLEFQIALDQYYNRRGFWAERVQVLKKSIDILRKADVNSRGLGQLELQLAKLYRRKLDNLDEALSYLQAGLKRLYPDEPPEDSSVGALYRHYGDIYRMRGEFRCALELYDRAGKLLTSEYHAHERGKLMSSIADAYARSGIDLDAALRAAEESLALQQQVQDAYEIIQSYRILADVQLARGEISKAESNIHTARRLFETDGQSENPLMGWILRTQGDVSYMRDELAPALACYNQAFTIFRTQQIGIGIAVIMKKLGLIHLRRGEIATALTYLAQALSTAEEIKGAKCVQAEVLVCQAEAVLLSKRPQEYSVDAWARLKNESIARLTQLLQDDDDLTLFSDRLAYLQKRAAIRIGVASSVSAAYQFDPQDALVYTAKSDFRLLQVFLDAELVTQADIRQQLINTALRKDIQLLCHAPGLFREDPALNDDLIRAAHEILSNTPNKWVVYHLDEQQPLNITIDIINALVKAGIIPCIENYHRLKTAEHGREYYRLYTELFQYISKHRIPAAAVIDIPRLFDSELGLSKQEAMVITNDILLRLGELNIPVLLHLIDSVSFDLHRKNWCPVGAGMSVIPYGLLLPKLFASNTLVEAIIFEFEDKHNAIPSRAFINKSIRSGMIEQHPTLVTQWWG